MRDELYDSSRSLGWFVPHALREGCLVNDIITSRQCKQDLALLWFGVQAVQRCAEACTCKYMVYAQTAGRHCSAVNKLV